MKDVLKKNKTIIVSIILLVFMLSLLMINNRINVKKYDGVVKVNEVKINTKGSSTEKEIIKKDDKEVVKEKETISSYSVLKYKINYKLETEGNTKRDAIIYVNLKDEDKKYIVIKDINDNNISSKMNGNTFEILVKNVETNINHSLEIEVTINNAPNGYKFSPEIVVKEKTSPETRKSVTPVEVKTTSLEGIVKTNDGTVAKNIEVKACIIDKDVCLNEKITYTDENGKYVFSNLDEGVYKIILPDGYITDENEANVETGSNELNIVYDQKGRFSASIKKYLEKVKIGDKDYDITKSQKVAIPILSKNYIVADYVFDIENISESDGYVKVIRETIPEGFKVSDSEINKDWKKDGNYYVNDTLKNDILTSGETREVRIQIESTSKVGADVYKNKVEILGESYHTVRYILDDELYKEFEIADGDKLENYKVERENYRFSGWYTVKNYTNKYNFDNLVTKDITVYGKLINTVIPKRKITYMSDDTTIFDEREIDDGDCAEDIEGPVKEGYTFKYWKKDGVKYFDSTICKPVHDDIILYSEDEINKYDVNYYIPGSLNEESGNYIYTGVNTKYDEFSSKVDYGTNITNPGSKELKYYNFKGWFKEDTYDNEVEYPLEIKTDTNIYGKYQIKKYTVEFYNDRADDEPFNTTVFNATTIFTAPETEVPEGYQIKRWEYEDGSTVTFGDIAGETFADYSEDDVIKVYRVIGGITYRVRYLDYNNELIDENAYEDLELDEWPDKMYDYENLLSDDTHREGYRFKGFTFNGENFYDVYYDGTHDYVSDLCVDKNDCVLDLVADYYDLSNMPIHVIFYDKMGSNYIETPKGETFDQTKIPAFTGVPGPWSSYTLPNRFTPIDWYEIIMDNGSPIYGPDGFEHYDEPFDFDNTIINKDTYLTAVYNPYKYILRFNKTDDSIQGEMTDQIAYMNTNDYSFSPYSTPNESLWVYPKNNEFVKSGYMFKGWATTPGGDIEVYNGSSINVLAYEDDDHKVADGEYLINLYPVFEEAEYTIIYSNNGGSGSMARTIFKVADTENGKLTKSTFTKAGNRFAGWSLNYGVSDIDFADEEPLTSLMNYMDEHSTDFLWIYAQYRPNTYTVKFLKSDESVQGEMADQLFNYGESKKLSKNLYTKEGYDFVGWENGNITYTDEQEVSNLASEDGAVVELTSKFEIKKYKVIFMNNNLEYEVQNNVTYGSNITPPSTNPTLDNKVFVGWKLNGEDNFFNFNDRVANDDIAEEIDGENVIILVSYYSNIEPPIITTEPTEWTNDKVKITLSNDKGYDMKIKVGDSSYTDYSEPVYTEENTRVKGKNVSGLEESGEAIKDIDNIDKIEPSISNFESIGNSRYVSVSLDTYDEDSGINSAKIILNVGSEEVTYCNISTDKEVINDKQTGPYTYSYYCDIDGLSESTTYTGKVVLTDVAGNVTEDDIEVTTSDITDIVARIISYDGVDIEDPENYINYPSLKDALIGCDEVSQTKKCTIQMVKNTRETNIINSDQNILLDLNGHEIDGVSANTFVINGKLQVVDHSNTYDENDPETLTSYEPIGKIINNHMITTKNENNEDVLIRDGVALLNNSTGTLILGENEVSDDEPGSIVSAVEPEIVSNYVGIDTSKSNNFSYYDGQITSDRITILGYVPNKPYQYNVNVISIEGGAQANLEYISTSVAKVVRTGIYYNDVASARDATYKGTYVATSIDEENLINRVEYGEDYPDFLTLAEIDGQTVLTDLKSSKRYYRGVVEIDLTDYEYNQLLTLTSSLQGSSNSNVAYASIEEASSTYTKDKLVDKTSNCFMNLKSENEKKDYSVYMEKGKKYYLYLYHYISDINDQLIIYDINLKSDTVVSDSHSFDEYFERKDSYYFVWKNRSLVNNNQNSDRSNAISTYKIDTTSYDSPKELKLNLSINANKSSHGYVFLNESRNHYSSDISNSIVTLSGFTPEADYTTTLQPGKIYYLHFQYFNYKDNSTKNTFSINDVKIDDISLFGYSDYEDSSYHITYNSPILNTELEGTDYKAADTIKLIQNVVLSETLEIEDNHDVILDLNGYNMSSGTSGSSSTSNYVIDNKGKLSIVDEKYSALADEARINYEQTQNLYDEEYNEKLVAYNNKVSEKNTEYEQEYIEEVAQYMNIRENKLVTVDDYVSNNLYAYYDNLSSTSDNLWEDLSNNNHNATIAGATYNVDHLSFDGEDDYLNLGKFDYDTRFVWDLIIEHKVDNKEQYIISNTKSGSGVSLKISENNKFILSSATEEDEYDYIIEKNKKYKVTLVSNNSNVKFYINNQYAGTISTSASSNGKSNLFIGVDGNNTLPGTHYFAGNIYSAKIYSTDLSEKQLQINFDNDDLKYDLNYILSDSFNGNVYSSTGNEYVYYLFDGNQDTIYSTSNDETISWSRYKENTIKSIKIYGTNDTSRYPTQMSFYGSKDGDSYVQILDDVSLEPKGLGEFNQITIDNDNLNSYRFYRWNFKNENGISISDIKLEEYNVIKKYYDEYKGDYFYKNYSGNNYLKFDGAKYNFVTTSQTSVFYYDKKIVVDDDNPMQVELYIAASGTVKIGFDSTINTSYNFTNGYTEYTNLSSNNKKITAQIDTPGEYYLKITYQTKNYSGYGFTIYSTSFSTAPIRQLATNEIIDTNSSINITKAKSSILNEEGAELIIDDIRINITYTSEVAGVINLGKLKLGKNGLIYSTSSSSIGIDNKKNGVLLTSEGRINVSGSSIKIENHPFIDYKIEGFNLENGRILLQSKANGLITRNKIFSGVTISEGNYGTVDIENNIFTGTTSFGCSSTARGTVNYKYNQGTGSISVSGYLTVNIIESDINGNVSISGNDATLNISNSILKGDGQFTSMGRNTVNINNSTINYGITIYSDNFNISGSTIKTNTEAIKIDKNNYINNEWKIDTKTINIEDCDLTSLSSTHVIDIESIKDSVININSSKIKSYGTAIYLKGNNDNSSVSNLFVTGNTVIDSVGTAIQNRYGKVTIGSKDNTANSIYPKIMSNTLTIDNQDRMYWYDGTIIGQKNNSFNSIDETEDNYDVRIRSLNPQQEIVDLYIPVLNSDESNAVAKIGDTKYATLTAAINDLDDSNKKIEIIKDFSTLNTSIINDNVKGIIDINGHEIDVYSSNGLLKNNGEIKVMDSAGGLILSKSLNVIENTNKLDIDHLFIEYLGAGNSIINDNGIVNVLNGSTLRNTGSSSNSTILNKQNAINSFVDSTITGYVKSYGSTSTLNTTITIDGGTYDYISGNNIEFNKGTILNSLNGDTIDVNATDNINTNIKKLYGNRVYIKDGTFERVEVRTGTDAYLTMDNGNVTDLYINSGIIKSGTIDRLSVDKSVDIGVSDGDVITNNPLITTSISVSSNSSAYWNWYDGAIKNYSKIPSEVEFGYNISEREDGYKILVKNYVAQIGEDKYYNIEDALSSSHCEISCSITLISNVSVLSSSDPINIDNGKTITIDLNGYSIRKNGEEIFINNGTLNLNNSGTESIFENSYYNKNDEQDIKYNITNNGVLNIDNVNMVGNLRNSNNGSLFVKDSTIQSLFSNDNAALEINSGTISNMYVESSNTSLIKNVNVDGVLEIGENANVTINGGTFIYKYQNNQVHKMIKNKGSLTIEEKDNKTVSIEYLYNTGTTNFISGEADYIENGNQLNLGINDGETTPLSPVVKELSDQQLLGSRNKITHIGNYNFYDGIIYSVLLEPNNIPSNYQVTFDSNDDYNNIRYLTPLNNKFKVGNSEYKTINEAFNSCTNNECTIELIDDYNISGNYETINIPSGKTITFDLNDKKLSLGRKVLFDNKGTLNIISENDAEINNIYNTLVNNSGLLNININGKISCLNYNLLFLNEVTKKLFINTGTINVNSGSIYTYDKLSIDNSGTFNINGGTFDFIRTTTFDIGETYGIANNLDAELNINNGTITGNIINNDNSHTYIYNGTLDGKIYINSSSLLDIYSGNIEEIANYGITNLVESNDGHIIVNKINNYQYANWNSDTEGTININGGTYSEFSTSSGHVNVSNANFTSTFTVNPYVEHSYYNRATVDISNSTFSSSDYCISNNISNISISNSTISNCSTGIINKGRLDLIENVRIENVSTGISNEGNVYLGKSTNSPLLTDPYIFGTENGITNSGTIYFNSGKIIGLPNQSIVGGTVVPEGYEKRITPGTGEYEGYEVTVLELQSQIVKVYEMNDINFDNIQTAFNSVIPGQENHLIIHKDATLENNVTVPDDTTIIIDKNGYNFDTNGFEFVGNNIAVRYSDGTSLLGTIRDLLNINPISIRKDIIVFADNTGNKLSSAEEYTLLYNNGGTFEEIDVKTDSVPGRFIVTSTSSNDKIVSYNGSVTINNIPDGEYKLVGDNGSVSTFKIEADGSLSGNIRTSYLTDTYTSNNILASSEAKMIVNLRTGNKYVRYGLIAGIIGLLLACFIYMKKMVRN